MRRSGYAVTDDELEPGLVAVAAPVYRDGAVVVAALSVSAPASRLTPARLPDVAAPASARRPACPPPSATGPAETTVTPRPDRAQTDPDLTPAKSSTTKEGAA